MQDVHIVPFMGGVDQMTPDLFKKDGALLTCVNYEPNPAGYRRMEGMERFDGRPKPSDATYWVLPCDAATSSPAAGVTVTGGTSGATGVLLVTASLGGGSGNLVLGEVAGTFVDDEDLEVSAVKFAEANGTAVLNDAATAQNDQLWTHLAANVRRALITAPAGSGAVRGVVEYRGTRYCIRDNAGATAAVLFKESATGWTAVDLGHHIRFTTGDRGAGTDPVEGATITGGTSAATATVERIQIITGSFAAGDATGYLHLSGITGTFNASETLTFTGSATAQSNGAEVANTLPVGGKYEWVIHNFFANTGSLRLYGCGGVGPAFEFDGTVFAPIFTGLDTALEKPKFIAQYRNYLFLGYEFGSWQHSSIGLPFDWQATGSGGAGEIGTGAEPAGAVSSSTVLVLPGRGKIQYLEGAGTTEEPFSLKTLSDDSGAIPYTVQEIDQPIYADGGAIRSLSQTEALGGFRMGSVTRAVETLFRRLAENGVMPVASMRVRDRDAYRLFLDNKQGITVYFGRQQPEIGLFELPEQVSCVYAGRGGNADRDTLMIGCENGMVYEMDVGTDWDGTAIISFARPTFSHFRGPKVTKRFSQIEIEADIPAYATLGISVDTDYGDPDLPPVLTATTNAGGGGFWDEFTWDNFIWDAQSVGTAKAFLDVGGESISPGFYHEGLNGEPAHTIKVAKIWYIPRGRKRR